MGQALTNKTRNKSRKVLRFQAKEEYFIKNGGMLLEKLIALSQGQNKGYGCVKVLSVMDIETAINGHEPNIVLGSSEYGTVYKGILDGLVVAILVPPEFNPNLDFVELYLTEASTTMVMIQDNIVNLCGCCLETCIPMLVFEFMPNSSIVEHLYGSASFGKSLKWDDRLKIAIDVSYALSYMHNALSKPVVHRDVQSNNILLGDFFLAKLGNLSHAVSITPGDSSQRWPVHGAPGYIDPEYIDTHEVTDKCDVYSFGVLLLELLTRNNPSMKGRGGTSLVDTFVSAMEKNQLVEIIDRDVLDQASCDEIERVTKLMLTCVAKKGIERPTMMEVVSELWYIQGK